MIDTHAHLDACAEEPAELVARARAAGVTRVVAVGSGLGSCRRTLEIAEREEGVYAALGIHPHQAGDRRDTEGATIAELAELLGHERAVAVGETGLDFFRDYAPRGDQVRLFEEQLALADALRLPVVVHSRAAEAETARLLEAFAGQVVLHCFSSPELLPVALERSYFVSFAGNVTYPRAGDLRAAAAAVSPERVLVETDSPYLAPQPRRGQPNEPANVVHTLAAVAAARGETADELERRVDANAAAVFGLP